MRRITLITIAACVLAGRALPVSAESSTGGAFILQGYGARAAGMAGAASAVIDDEGAVDWIPARMGLSARTLGASYLDVIPGGDLAQSQVAFVSALGRREEGVAYHAIGVMFTNLSADIGDVSTYSENHLRVAYALTPQPFVGIAIAGQLFYSRSGVAGFDAWGSSFDFSGRLSLSRHWEFGVVTHDLFSRYSFDDGTDAGKEYSVVTGLATTRLPLFTLSADAVRQYATWTQLRAGVETPYIFSHVALRAGVALRRAGEARTSLAFGASLRFIDARVFLHYAASIDDDEAFGTTHRLGLAVRL